MRITDELVDYLAQLSRLELGQEERLDLKRDLSDMLDYMDQLGDLDTAGMPEMSHPFEANQYLRDDQVTGGDQREAALSNAPTRKGDYFKVSRALGEGGAQ